MSKCLVKYKLEKCDKGFKNPDIIFDGGILWSNNVPGEMVLVGTADIKDKKNLPPHIIEIITPKKLKDHQIKEEIKLLNQYKLKLFQTEADPLFNEAYREKELGNDKKWKSYLKVCSKIKKLKKLPEDI